MSKKMRNFLALSAASISFMTITTAGIAQAWETFFVQENLALNTNNNFRRIDGNPRMSIYQRNDNDADQQFERLSGNKGGLLLKHRSTGKCLNAHYLDNGKEINVWPCDANDPDQNWNLVDVGGGYNLIKRTGTNLCVDTPTRNNEGKVHLWTCDGNNGNQRWKGSTYSSGGGSTLSIPVNLSSVFYTKSNIFWLSGYGGPNCTWYANGRMKELGYSSSALNTMRGNAHTWDNTASNGATVSSTPQVASIAVWEPYVNGAGSLGHVAVVEQINSNGTIVISESNWPKGTMYGTRTLGASNWPSKFITVPK